MTRPIRCEDQANPAIGLLVIALILSVLLGAVGSVGFLIWQAASLLT